MSNREDARDNQPAALGVAGADDAPASGRRVVHTPDDSHPLSDTAVAPPVSAAASADAERAGYGTAPTELSGTGGAGETAAGDRAPGAGAKPGGGDDGVPGDRDSLVGVTLLDRFQITAKLGQGGMGAVYEARHTVLNKRIAIKVLLDKFAHKDLVVARLKQEAQLASAIGHEHIIDMTDFGETADGRTFVVMEYLDGEPLSELLAREGPLPEQRAIRIAHQIASALYAAHEKGIVHRDIKPENIFLLQRKGTDFVKVVDFGISKSLRPEEDGESSQRLTKTGMVIGTPLYMSPEQARGDDDLDHRIDIYALGVILYEMVTGRVPFQGNNYLSIISQVLNDEPPMPRDLRPDLSPELEAVILRALDKDAAERYQSCDELAGDLYILIEDPGRTTANKRITAPLRRRRRKGERAGLRVLWWIAGVAVIATAVVVTVAVILPGGAPRPAASAPPIPDAAPPPQVPDAAPAPQKAHIQIITYPRGADIFHNNRLVGRASLVWKTDLVDERITLVAKHDGYEDTPFEVNPAADSNGAPVEVDLIRRVPGADAVPGAGPGKRKPDGGRRPARVPPPDKRTPSDKKPPPVKKPHDLDPNPY